MKRILLSLVMLGATSILAIGATTAFFSDTEISSGNTITAGTLDLKLDGVDNPTTAKFDITNAKPEDQPKRTFILKNAGSILGHLKISEVTLTNLENTLTEPEDEAGDTTADVGELADVIDLTIFVDYSGDGWVDAGEPIVFSGKVKDLPTAAPITLTSLAAGSEVHVEFIMNWFTATPGNNLAQGDSILFDIEFTLSQN